MIKKWVFSVLVFCAVLFVFWCGGVDLDKRGFGIGFAMVYATSAAFLTYAFCFGE